MLKATQCAVESLLVVLRFLLLCTAIKSTALPPTASVPENKLVLPPPPAMTTTQQADQWGPPRRDVDIAAAMTIPDITRGNPYSVPNAEPQIAPIQHYNVREVVVQRGAKGYGFAMRGVKATKAVKFTPTPQVPALQYIGNVEAGGSADLAGLKTGDFLLEINYHNVTYCTHDDVVSIIRNAGTSLHMKVITPLLDPNLRTSIQLQQQVEISDTTNALDHQHTTMREDLPVRIDAPTMPQYSGSVNHDTVHRETVIDDVPRQPLRKGENSPSLDRINQSGWDSSQDETTHTPGTPSRVQKFSYLQGAVNLPTTHQSSPKRYNRSATLPHGSTMTQALSSKHEPGHTLSERIASLKSSTLPPQNDHPVHASSSPDSSDSEEESEFTKAVKKGKAKLSNSPAMRQRASTMPSKSPQRIPFSNQDHSNSSPTGSLKKQNTPPSSENAPPTFRQPLAEAIMRKIDSIRIDQKDDDFSDDEGSFTKTPPMRPKSYTDTKEKAAPPAPKPKPQFRRAHTMGPGSAASNNFPNPASQLGTELNKCDDKSTLSDGEDAPDGGVVNWKSALRPVKRTESGRASPGIPDHGSSRNFSTSKTQSPGKVQDRPNEVTNSQMQFGMESGSLPPPLPAINNRFSAEYLDLPPPEDFLSLPGVETGETCTDDIIPAPPPPHREIDSEGSPSPPPPPPPDSSPPREPLDSSQLIGVQFQAGIKRTPPSSAGKADKFPSPLPSPAYPSSFDSDMGSEPVLPPQEFVSSREEKGNIGFEIPIPPGFEIPTPPSSNAVPTESVKRENTEPDLNEAIRQLQQLSDTLTVTPSEKLNGTSHGSKHNLSPKRSETVATKRDEMAMVAESPVYTPPIRSRSSTSSSNVSSLPREAEVDQSGTPAEMPKARAHMTAAYREKLVTEWEVEEVCEWLEDIGLGEHCPQFQENEILGEHLLELTKEELAELGVKKIGHKKTFLTKVKELMPSS